METQCIQRGQSVHVPVWRDGRRSSEERRTAVPGSGEETRGEQCCQLSAAKCREMPMEAIDRWPVLAEAFVLPTSGRLRVLLNRLQNLAVVVPGVPDDVREYGLDETRFHLDHSLNLHRLAGHPV